MQAGEEYNNRVYDIHLEKLHHRFDQQNRLSSWVSLINPYLALRQLSMGLSATDLHTSIHFEATVEAYRRSLVKRMNRDMTENSDYGEFYAYKASSNLWKEIERFSYRTPSTTEILQHYTIEIISLLFWTIFMTLLLHYSDKKAKIIDG